MKTFQSKVLRIVSNKTFLWLSTENIVETLANYGHFKYTIKYELRIVKTLICKQQQQKKQTKKQINKQTNKKKALMHVSRSN